jgi:hypothetical protein
MRLKQVQAIGQGGSEILILPADLKIFRKSTLFRENRVLFQSDHRSQLRRQRPPRPRRHHHHRQLLKEYAG